MTLMERRRALMAVKKGGGGIPSEYQQCEWIGYSSRNVWIYTYIPVSDVSKVVADIEKMSVPSYGTVFPYGYSTNSWGTIENVNGSAWVCEPTYAKNVLFPRTTFTSTKNGATSSAHFGMCLGYISEPFCPTLRFYSYKMYNSNDSLLFDGIPCYRKSDGNIGLYDLVAGSFFGSDGTWEKGADA